MIKSMKIFFQNKEVNSTSFNIKLFIILLILILVPLINFGYPDWANDKTCYIDCPKK